MVHLIFVSALVEKICGVSRAIACAYPEVNLRVCSTVDGNYPIKARM
jgi:hypothetical protein